VTDRAVLLDVGHGNCTVFHIGNQVAVVDAGRGSTLLDYVREENVSEIEVVLLSHADQDHIAGLLGLLVEGILVKEVYVNPDALRNTAVWEDLAAELGRAWNAGRTVVKSTLSSGDSPIRIGLLELQVVAPSPVLVLSRSQRTATALNANSLSAVVRAVYDGRPIGIFPGDLDQVGFEKIVDPEIKMSAPLLVYPHHGGQSGADADKFATTLVSTVQPRWIVFSIGRGRYQTPRPDIVGAVRRSAPRARVVCTQLADHCATAVPGADPHHLNATVARGRDERRCCGGSLIMPLTSTLELLPDPGQHLTFIRANAGNALCQAVLPGSTTP